MGNDKGPITWLKKQFFSNEEGDKKNTKYHYLVLVLLFGAAIMIFSNLFVTDQDENGKLPVFNQGSENSGEDVAAFGQSKSSENQVIKDYEAAYETQLKEALEGIRGVSDVTVVVNVEATERRVLEKNKVTQSQITDEVDREGGKRKVEDSSTDEQVVIIRDGEKEVPIVLETLKPEIRGVLVVANGAENIQVKKWIVEAVTRALDVPSHRVAVMPKKSKGD